MANRGKLITRNHLNCPACNYDYSNTNIIERFDKCGNNAQMIIVCDCKKTLTLRLLVNGWFKIYDMTNRYIQMNARAREKRRIRNGTIQAR